MSISPFAYRRDIDGLRALAIVPVVLFHAFPGHLPGGFVGVDVFFVISGYLISGILISEFDEGRFSLVRFYQRRIRRVFPALALVLVTCLVVGWFSLTADEYRSLGKHAFGGAAFISNLVLASESGYFDTAAELKPLLNLWSLGVEEQFYIVWPLLLWLVYRYRWPLWPAMASMAILSLASGIVMTLWQPTLAFFLPHTRFWELLTGAVMALHGLRHAPLVGRKADIVAAIGLVMIVASVAFMSRSLSFPGAWALIPVVGAALVIAGGSSTVVGKHLLGNKLMVFIGLISYPLYLWHWPALVHLRLTTPGDPGSAKLWLCVAISALLAWGTYNFLEKPLRNAGTFGFLSRFRVDASVLLPLLGVMVAAAIGLCVRGADGFPQRVPVPIAALADFKYDTHEQFRRNRCHLNMRQHASEFAPECTTPGMPNQPIVMLWGDSHAGHLYAGLRQEAATRGFTLIQHTFSGCPPLPNYSPVDAPLCSENNDWVIKRIHETSPDIVIVAGHWRSYKDFGNLSIKAAKLIDLAQRLSENSNTRIIIVGPVPEWYPTLPRVLLNLARGDGPINSANLKNIPRRTQKGLEAEIFDSDTVFRHALSKGKIDYFSALNVLCQNQQCITIAQETGVPIAYDSAHLTLAGSELIAAELAKFINKSKP